MPTTAAATPRWAAIFYPKAPDMRLPRTQQLSDGEMFYFIENGVRADRHAGLEHRNARR